MQKHIFLSMNQPCTLGVFPDKKVANPIKALSVNCQDPLGAGIVKGILLPVPGPEVADAGASSPPPLCSQRPTPSASW
jgi:hypothetical protein